MILPLLQPDPTRAALWNERARLLAEMDRVEHRIRLEAESLGMTVEEALAVAWEEDES